MGLKDNDWRQRYTHATRKDFQRNPEDMAQSRHGTPEELQARLGGTFTTLPDTKPSTMKLFGRSRGGNINDERPIARKGGPNQKFGNGREYLR